MKKLIVLFVTLWFTYQATAQISLEKTFTESAWITNLAVSGYKYYTMDVVNNQCKLYNLDYTLWKTIPLSVASGYTLYDIQYVSENLFSTDGMIAMAYMYYQYNSTGQYYTYEVRVIKENGTVLLTVPGAAYMYVITAGTTATKFLTYRFDYATYPYFLGTNIYGLPGVFVGEQGIIPGNEEGRKAFPNPASTSITIPLPSKSSEANRDLIVSDANGREILRTSLAKEQLEYTLNTSSFPKGTYLYLIVSGSTVSHQDKFVVQR